MKVIFLSLLIVLLLFSILIGIYLSMPNLRKFKKDNMSATGCLYINKKAKFYSIDIGTPQAPFDHEKNLFSIKLKNGKIIKSNDFLQTAIEEIATFQREKKADKNQWDVNIIEYDVEGYTFTYSKNMLLHFNAARVILPDKILEVKIGTFDAKEFFELPIEQSNLEKIFGKPDRVIDSFTW